MYVVLLYRKLLHTVVTIYSIGYKYIKFRAIYQHFCATTKISYYENWDIDIELHRIKVCANTLRVYEWQLYSFSYYVILYAILYFRSIIYKNVRVFCKCNIYN